jgi:hypothetical protein
MFSIHAANAQLSGAAMLRPCLNALLYVSFLLLGINRPSPTPRLRYFAKCYVPTLCHRNTQLNSYSLRPFGTKTIGRGERRFALTGPEMTAFVVARVFRVCGCPKSGQSPVPAPTILAPHLSSLAPCPSRATSWSNHMSSLGSSSRALLGILSATAGRGVFATKGRSNTSTNLSAVRSCGCSREARVEW